MLACLWVKGCDVTESTARKASRGGVLSAVIAGVCALFGGLIGLITAVIVWANFVISVVGHPDGYEASPIEVFRYSPLGGVIDVLILVAGPALGAWFGWAIARRITR